MAKREPNYHGLLIIDKPGRITKGLQIVSTDPKPDLPTSHDIVQLARRWTQQRRIGHTGTLDPMASGVLLLCLGDATRLVEYYQNHDKQYFAEICLGIATDTYDAMGIVTDQSPVPPLTYSDIVTALAQFQGEILQMPPSYSAIKQDGESLYQKARRGEEISVEPRKVIFHQLDLIDFVPPDRVILRVVCSAGTYIRSLAYDLGRALGTFGYLDYLRREAAGPFLLENAHTVQTVLDAVADNSLEELILPLGVHLDMPSVSLDEDEKRRLGFGQPVMLKTQIGDDQLSPGLLAVAFDQNAHFAGIIRCIETTFSPADGSTWKAEKWLAKQ